MPRVLPSLLVCTALIADASGSHGVALGFLLLAAILTINSLFFGLFVVFLLFGIGTEQAQHLIPGDLR